MKITRFTEEPIAFALHHVETGTRVIDVIRKMGISEQTFYRWKRECGGLGVNELWRPKQLEEENRRLKQLIADLSLDKVMLQNVIRSNVWSASSVQVFERLAETICVNDGMDGPAIPVRRMVARSPFGHRPGGRAK